MILIDLTHTSHSRVNTGIQRVCRMLYYELIGEDSGIAVAFDPFRDAWRKLNKEELRDLCLSENDVPDGKRGKSWPIKMRIEGYMGRIFNLKTNEMLPQNTHYEGLIAPEIFSPQQFLAYKILADKIKGPKIAVFYDAVTLSLPEYAPKKTIEKFPAYLNSLLWFDGITAISEASKNELLNYWEDKGHKTHPPVVTIPLGTNLHPLREASETKDSAEKLPTILTVATIEGRKNHLSLLRAAETLWEQGFNFRLRLVGKMQNETGEAAFQYIQKLQQMGRDLIWTGPLSEKELHAAYRECAFTVYPSLYEGFGIPILESLSFGKPCICSNGGALPESAHGGGCLILKDPDAKNIAVSISNLLRDPDLFRKLSAEACARRYKSWKTYSHELMDWMNSLQFNRVER